MSNNSFINIVGIRCEPGFEAKFAQWYDQVHIPLVTKFKGLKKVTHYKIANPTEGYPIHLGIFEFENQEAFEAYEKSPELAAARQEKDVTWAKGGWDRMWRVQYETVKKWENK